MRSEHQTSLNDALVRLAYDGAARYERLREIAALATCARAMRSCARTPVAPDARPRTGEETEAPAHGLPPAACGDDRLRRRRGA